LLRLRWYGYSERTKNERMPKQTATARMEVIRERGRAQKRWTDEVGKDLKLM
jgi:hypothetical protein